MAVSHGPDWGISAPGYPRLTEDELRPISDALHERIKDDEREGRSTESDADVRGMSGRSSQSS